MKNHFFYLLSLVVLISGVLAGCNQKKESSKEKETSHTIATSKEERPLKIAYVRADSVLNQSLLYQDMSEELNRLANSNQATINAKMADVQKDLKTFQEKLQNRGFVSELAAQQEQEKILKKQQNIESLGVSLQESFLKKQALYNDSLNTIIKEKVEELNKELGYDFILTSVMTQNLLYGNPDFDITDKVVEAINADYKKNNKEKK